jgi:hypothetical protein
MRFHAIRAAVTVVAVSAALVGAQTLITASVAHAAGGVCTFAFNKNPYVLHKAVVVGGVVECSPAPIKFRIEMQLWHRSGTSNPRTKGEAAVSTQIPNPHLNVAAMALECVPGVWQGKIVMRATWDTGTDEGSNATTPTFIQC